MPVLVTGATGFIGQAVVGELRAAGHAVRVLVRNPASVASQQLMKTQGVELCAGTFSDRESLSKAVQGIGAIIHLVGIISEVGENTFQSIHVEATRNLLAAAQTLDARRYLHMSALGTRPQAASRYHQTKWAAEELVRQSGLDWTIFRPSIVYGVRDQFTNFFARMARCSPVMPVMGAGQGKLQPIAVENVAQAFARALTEPRAIGRTFDLCGPEVFTFERLLSIVLAEAGRKRALVHLPMPVARMQARLMELIYPTLLRRASPLTSDQLLMLQEDNVGDSETARELFKLKFRPFAESVRAYLRMIQ